MQHVVPLKTDRTLPPELLLEQWRVYLQEDDRSVGTVKKYNELQHEQRKSISTINLQVSALRTA
jgi:hypothetical protein